MVFLIWDTDHYNLHITLCIKLKKKILLYTSINVDKWTIVYNALFIFYTKLIEIYITNIRLILRIK